EAETRSYRLLALHRLSTAAAGRADPRTTLRLIARAAVDLLAWTSSAVYLWDEAEGVLRLTARAGAGDEPPDSLRPGEGLAGRILLSAKQFVVDESGAHEPTGATDTRGAGFPLLARGRLLGALCVQSGGAGPPASDEDLCILEVLANQGAAAVER